MGVDGLVHVAPGHCPPGSQIGEVEVVTPLLASPLKGHVYVAEPSCGGEGQRACTEAMAADGELFGLYLELAGSGVIVKLKGTVAANPQTGQLTTTFTEAPQLPFSEVLLRLTHGPRAPLANPQECGSGSFTATADLTPWSAPETPDATPSSSFNVTGCNGDAFSPVFRAGTVSPTAGAYSPFTLTFSRKDGEQDLSGLSVDMPEGLLGKIAGFAQCGEAEVKAAEADTGGGAGGCPGNSKLGTATAAVGAGSDPPTSLGRLPHRPLRRRSVRPCGRRACRRRPVPSRQRRRQSSDPYQPEHRAGHGGQCSIAAEHRRRSTQGQIRERDGRQRSELHVQPDRTATEQAVGGYDLERAGGGQPASAAGRVAQAQRLREPAGSGRCSRRRRWARPAKRAARAWT